VNLQDEPLFAGYSPGKNSQIELYIGRFLHWKLFLRRGRNPLSTFLPAATGRLRGVQTPLSFYFPLSCQRKIEP
jgi:hypothetical protein